MTGTENEPSAPEDLWSQIWHLVATWLGVATIIAFFIWSGFGVSPLHLMHWFPLDTFLHDGSSRWTLTSECLAQHRPPGMPDGTVGEPVDHACGVYLEEIWNVWYLIRTTSLGSLGAFATVLFGCARSGRKLLDEPLRMIAGLCAGAITALAVFGLLYGKFTSLLPQVRLDGTTPDYWTITSLSLLSGAFADLLFDMASVRITEWLSRKPK